MAEDLIPAQQPAYLGEWNFNGTITAPPSTGQVRLNNGSQPAATLLWVHKQTANGMTADILAQVVIGNAFNMHDKDDATKWQSYVVTTAPIDKTSYWEFPILWLKGGVALPAQRMMFEVTGIRVGVTGKAVTASSGSVSVVIDDTKHAYVEVTAPLCIRTKSGNVEIIGHILLPDQAFPSDTPMGFSPGMTMRQFYAGQAMMGFIANQSPAANLLGGKLAEYCFKAADSMIEFEQREAAGILPPVVGENRVTALKVKA